jgi:hypothetical protein
LQLLTKLLGGDGSIAILVEKGESLLELGDLRGYIERGADRELSSTRIPAKKP